GGGAVTDPVQLVISRLEGVSGSDGQYTARCPAHDDHQASLSIGTGADGRALLKCFAGCPATSIVEHIGLKMQDLYPAKETAVAVAEPALTLAELAADKGIPADYLR